jgi:hypothetical protein
MKYSEDNVVLFGTKMIACMMAMKQSADILATINGMEPTDEQHGQIMEKIRVAIKAARDCARHLSGEEDPMMAAYKTVLQELSETMGDGTPAQERVAARVRAKAKQGLEIRI